MARDGIDSFEVLIVGGGPAGLSAALVLGRARRRVALVDDDRPRNEPALATHGFFTRDGATPQELRRLGREQARRYGVEVIDARAVDVEGREGAFRLQLHDGRWLGGRRLLLATGLRDPLPDRPGFRELYGKGVHHCPYCDGWEVRDRRLASYGRDTAAAEEALGLKQWSSSVVLLSDGQPRVPRPLLRRLARNDVEVEPRRLAGLTSARGRLAAVEFAGGGNRPLDAIFFVARPRQQSDLASRLGLQLTRRGTVKTGRLEETNVAGVFVAGDASRDVQQISVAVAEGTKAAIALNKSLRHDDLR